MTTMFLFYIILAFAATIIASTLLLRVGMGLMARRAGAYIDETHQHIEYIISTRNAPQDWTASFVTQSRHAHHQSPHNQHRQRQIQTAAQKACLKKLNKLIAYARNSPIFQDDETRQILLQDLTAVSEEWKTQEWTLI